MAKSSPVKVQFAAAVDYTGPSSLFDALAAKLLYAARILSADKEIIIYAAIAVFGVLMMALAISSSAPHDQNKTDAMLDLLKQEKDRAENLAKLKSEFLNQVSHELRTPLAVIIGYLECLNDGLYGKIDVKHQQILEVVAKQSGHLKNMIDQVLIFSRLEANKESLHVQEFSPTRSLADLRDTFDFLCAKKGIALNWDLSRTTPAIKNDPDKFKEIASNILQNAVKYTDRGSIHVTLRSLTPTDSIVFEVTDTGVGIPQNALTSIFEPFIQVHQTSTENSRGGIGLGLSIVKKHIEQMRGTITVDSEVGKGSTFRVILPRVYRNDRNGRDRLFRWLVRPFGRPHKQKAESISPTDVRTENTKIPNRATT